MAKPAKNEKKLFPIVVGLQMFHRRRPVFKKDQIRLLSIQ